MRVFVLGISALAAASSVVMAQIPTVTDGKRPILGAESGSPVTQLIVRYRTDSAKSMTADAARQKTATLSAKGGVALAYKRPMSGAAHVYRLHDALPFSEAFALARRLELTDPQVEYAEPDIILRSQLVPNDPVFAGAQWHLKDPAGNNAGGASLPGAWDVVRGDNVVVAVVDTGDILHPDLSPNVIGGADFITDAAAARDGNGRDATPSDEGTWGEVGECNGNTSLRPSSWHGAHVAGTIAAVANNGSGVAGVAYNAKILHARALGRCGSGPMSDIIDAIRWSAGLAAGANGMTWAQLGLPANSTPAKVINLSLGASPPTACSPSGTMQSAINEARAAGVVIVAATGNDGQPAAIGFPANCNGVIAVTAHNFQGDNADYANVGPGTKVSAPGGGACSASGGGFTCLTPSGMSSSDPNYNNFWVWSTVLSGQTTPASPTPVIGGKVGTSMATPHVSGVAALLLSRMPNLTPAEVEFLITSSARAFPVNTYCRAFSDERCGKGMLDAVAAIMRLTDRTPTVQVTPSATVALGGTSVALNAQATARNGGSAAFTYTWRQTAGATVALTGANSAVASFVATNPGGTHTFEVTARDANGYSTVQSVNVRSNNAPTVAALAAQSVTQGGNLTFTLVGTDPEGDSLTYVATDLPSGATFSAATGVFSWSQIAVAPGAYTVSVLANDGVVNSSPIAVTINVAAAATPPSSSGGGGGGSLSVLPLALLAALSLARRVRRE